MRFVARVRVRVGVEFGYLDKNLGPGFRKGSGSGLGQALEGLQSLR